MLNYDAPRLEWFGRFARSLVQGFPLHDWPTKGTDEFVSYWQQFERTLAALGVDEEAAQAATRQLVVEKVRFASDVRHQFVQIVREQASQARREQEAAKARERLRADERKAEQERERLESLWAGLPQPARDRWLARALEQYPALARWPSWLRHLAMEALGRATDPAAVEVLADPRADLF